MATILRFPTGEVIEEGKPPNISVFVTDDDKQRLMKGESGKFDVCSLPQFEQTVIQNVLIALLSQIESDPNITIDQLKAMIVAMIKK